MKWAGLQSEDLLIFYDAYSMVVSDYDCKKKRKKKCREILKTTSNELNSFKYKFILLHFSMFLTGAISKKSKYKYSHYNPGYRHFLFNFIEISFEKSRARKLLQILEKCFGEFIKNTLNFEHQDPVKSPLSQPFITEGYNDTVSYAMFLQHMSENKSDFEAYVKETFQPGKFGESEDNRYLDEKELLKDRKLILKESKQLVEETKEELKAQFELISPECDLGRHAVITVSGFLSEKDDNTESWIGLCKTNSTLPVYSYRWSSKGSWSMLKPIIPTSVKSFFEWKNIIKKWSIAIKLITLPFDYRAIFLHAIEIAKKSGKLLAHSLMLQFPFVNQSISLVGFSLGTQVIFSCLEELKAHNADNIGKFSNFNITFSSQRLFPWWSSQYQYL